MPEQTAPTPEPVPISMTPLSVSDLGAALAPFVNGQWDDDADGLSIYDGTDEKLVATVFRVSEQTQEDAEGNARLLVAAFNSHASHFNDPVRAAEADRLGRALDALRSVHAAVQQATLGDLLNAIDADDNAHIEISISVAEARAIRAALAGTKEPAK